jgi:glutamyl-Q tRNA(Asp) synthetase
VNSFSVKPLFEKQTADTMVSASSAYRGRFAPSPTGPLHAGSLVAALASWLDARAHHGRWLVRMEDIDQPRCKTQHAEYILRQLAEHGLTSDGPVLTQSQRLPLYENALLRLTQSKWAYPCSCSRKQILEHLAGQGEPLERHQDRVYPGTCRSAATPAPLQNPGQHYAWRYNTEAWQGRASCVVPFRWQDRRLGEQAQDLAQEVGDFVLKRADGYFAYQLVVVVDDEDQGITHVVRGEDLADNTVRQIALQQALGYRTPLYLHIPLVLDILGEKLSKQNGAQALSGDHAWHNLHDAARCLGLNPTPLAGHASPQTRSTLSDLLGELVSQWAHKLARTPW